MKIISSVLAAVAPTIPLGKPISGIGKFQDTTELTNNPSSILHQFISTIITSLSVIASLAFAIYFILGGLKWITAGDKEQSIKEAKDQMVHSALGLIVVVIAYFVIGLIGNILGIDILSPGTILGL